MIALFLAGCWLGPGASLATVDLRAGPSSATVSGPAHAELWLRYRIPHGRGLGWDGFSLETANGWGIVGHLKTSVDGQLFRDEPLAWDGDGTILAANADTYKYNTDDELVFTTQIAQGTIWLYELELEPGATLLVEADLSTPSDVTAEVLEILVSD